jgi:malonate decarboxylase epsilon subunit
MRLSACCNFLLAALVGLSETQVCGHVEVVSSEAHPVFVGNVSAPRQIVIAGNIDGMKEVLSRTAELGARKAELLHVSVPSHQTYKHHYQPSCSSFFVADMM